MFVVGFGSFMFHGTMRFEWEMWDAWSFREGRGLNKLKLLFFWGGRGWMSQLNLSFAVFFGFVFGVFFFLQKRYITSLPKGAPCWVSALDPYLVLLFW